MKDSARHAFTVHTYAHGCLFDMVALVQILTALVATEHMALKITIFRVFL